MKAYLFLVIFISVLLSSCSNDIIESNKEDNKELKTNLFTITTVNETDYSKVYSSIKNWNNKNLETKIKSSSNEEKNDLSIINISYLPEIEIIFSKSDLEEYQYSAYLKNNQGIYGQFYMNINADDIYYNITYYPINGESFSIKINKLDGTFVKQITKSAGQRTMDCIQDAYSNHGWVSVWVTVQSIFIPMTGVAIAAACAGGNVM